MEGGLSTVQSWPCRDDDDGDADGFMKHLSLARLLGTIRCQHKLGRKNASKVGGSSVRTASYNTVQSVQHKHSSTITQSFDFQEAWWRVVCVCARASS